MEFNSQICTTKEQSERLLTLGLKRDTADMYRELTYSYNFKNNQSSEEWITYLIPYSKILEDGEKFNIPICFNHIIPAWSLHRLLCLLPTEYTYDIDFQQIMQDFVFGSQDMYDEVISCIETLIKEGYFYEEYLN